MTARHRSIQRSATLAALTLAASGAGALTGAGQAQAQAQAQARPAQARPAQAWPAQAWPARGPARSGGPTYPTVPPADKVSISLASYLPSFGTPGINTLNGLVQGFEHAHPNITVTVQAETAANIPGQIQQDIVAGQAPDVVQETFNDAKFVASGLGAADLSKVVGAASLSGEFGGKYRYAPAVTKLGMIGRDVYGIPWTLSTPVLFYNATLFQKAGLDSSKPPATWAEVQSDAARIKSATGASGLANGCLGAGAAGFDWCLQSIVDSAGGSVMNAAQTRTTFSSSGVVSALQTMQQLAASGAMVNLSSAQAVQAWAGGQLAMVLNSSALQSTLISASGGRFEMRAAREPGFGTLPSVPTNSGSALYMLSRSRLKREADWELIQYLTSPASETAITEGIGYPPLRPSIAAVPQYLQTWGRSNPYLAVNLGQLEHIKPWLAYPGPNYGAVQTTLLDAAAAVVFQGGDVKATLARAQATASQLIGK